MGSAYEMMTCNLEDLRVQSNHDPMSRKGAAHDITGKFWSSSPGQLDGIVKMASAEADISPWSPLLHLLPVASSHSFKVVWYAF
jgi:hypothetical protein